MRNPFITKNTLESLGSSRPFQNSDEPIEFEESIIDPQSPEILEQQGAKTKFHFSSLLVVSILAFGLLGVRLYYLTIIKHGYFREIAEGNRLRIEYLSSPRGAIFDSRGVQIAGSRPSFELVLSPLDLPKDPAQKESVIRRVSEIFQIPPEDLRLIVTSEGMKVYESVLVKQNVSREQTLLFHEQSVNLPGFRILNVPIRNYENSVIYSHLLGFVGKISPEEYAEKTATGYLFNDSLGKNGIEQQYEEYLRGKFGQRRVEVDARGTVKKIFGEKPPESGLNLVLNLDAELQESLYNALQSRLRMLGRKKAAAIALNPQNGKVLAFLSLPGFDNNLFAEGIPAADYQKLVSDKNEPLFNRAIAGTYPPGSTVKPLVAAGALQEGVITSKTVIDDRGFIVIRNNYGGPDSYFYGYGRKALGVLDVRKAVALSSDVFFYITGGGYEPAKIAGMGIEKLAEYYRRFAVGERLGIDLPGEASGLVPDPEWKRQRFGADGRWYLGNTYHVSIGQGDLLASPLHVVSWIATIANEGKIYKPLVVDRVEDWDGRVVRKFEPEVIRNVNIEPQYLQIAREGMREAVVGGTARALNSLGVAVAAKTGTAQFDAKDPNRSHAWFAAFAPYDDPQIAIVVLIEDGGEGGVNSMPVVRETLDWWIKNRLSGQRQ